MGDLADLQGPAALIGAAIAGFCRAYDVDMGEAVVPEGGFSSFNEFFTRKLLPGSRTIDSRSGVVVSPADGRVEDLGPIEEGARLWVKGTEYDVGELLGDPRAASALVGGRFFIVYLSPRDYHRVHAPVDGPVTLVRHVGGTLYPVNSIGLTHVPRLFARNERVVTTQRVEAVGDVATIMVGAIGVGRISSSFEPRVLTNAGAAPAQTIGYGASGPHLARGQELGVFHLGSTAIVLVPPAQAAEFEVGAGAVVRMGQAILRLGAV